MNTIKKIITFLLFLLAWCAPTSTFATEVFSSAKSQSFAPGEEFLVNVFLNTENESVNAIEGKVSFSSDLFDLKEIRDGKSIITLWIEKPKLETSNKQQGSIIFSGVTPGGFLGQKEPLFSAIFRAKKAGNGFVNAEGIRVLRNDGEGTEVNVTMRNFDLKILDVGKVHPESQISPDAEPPEDFKPFVVSDPNMFGGKQVLIFATEDKVSGIDHYEVREGRVGWFSAAESPYLLKHQWLDREIFVKAVNRAGNERIAILLPQQQASQPKPYALFGIIIILAIVVILVLKKIRKKTQLSAQK